MKVRRLPLGIVVPVLLIGLVAVLAWLQYRWLGQVSEAERTQLRRSFTQRAVDFADEFDLELSRAYVTLQLSQADVTAADWTKFAAAVDRWQETARYPQMVRAIYLAERGDGGLALRTYRRDARGFDAAAGTIWPPELEPARRQLDAAREVNRSATGGADVLRVDPQHATAGRTLTIALAAVNAEVPALIVPVSPGPLERTPAPAAPAASRTQSQASPAERALTTFMWLEREDAHVILELDRDYIRDTVLPALAAKHFPDPGAGTYRVAVLSASGDTLFSSGLAGASLSPEQADVVMPMLTIRPDLARAFFPQGSQSGMALRTAAPKAEDGQGSFEGRMSVVIMSGPQGAAASQQPSATQFRLSRPSWRLVLQHGAGSLDAAVTRARRRNLVLSFGILAVLSVGIALVVANARRSEQLAARQMEFVATVSHELRTPLTVIRSAAQNLSAGVVADHGQTKRYGELIDGEGRRLTDMVEQILDYAGLTGNRSLRLSQLTDVGALVNDLMTSYGPVVAQAGCTADVTVEEGLLVLADQDALRRAVQNLVANAVNHASGGRWIGVSVSAASEGSRPQAVITVRDRGHGIPASELPHIFDPFYRGRHAVERQVHGNGLGLSLVKRIVEAHAGRITVHSDAGEGATFTIVLPLAPDDAAATGADGGPRS